MGWVHAQIVASANSEILLPPRLWGSVTVLAGTPNVTIRAAAGGSIIRNPHSQGILVGTGSGNDLPATYDTDWPITGWTDEETFTVDGFPSWAAGTYLWVYPVDKGEAVADGDGRPIGGFIAKVASNIDDVVVIADPMPTGFVTNFASIFADGWQCRPIATPARNINILGRLELMGQNNLGVSGSPQGIFAHLVDGLRIEDAHTLNHYSQGMYLARCNNLQVTQVSNRNCGSHNAGAGYLIELDQCKDVVAQGIYGEGPGRPLTVSKSAFGHVITDLTGKGCRTAIGDWHGGGSYGNTWRRWSRFPGLVGATFAEGNIETGNTTHTGPALGLTIEDSAVQCIQVKNNCDVTLKRCTVDMVQFQSGTIHEAFAALPAKVRLEQCQNGFSWNTAVVQGTLGCDAEVTIVDGSYNLTGAKGLVGSADATYKMITAGFDMTLSIDSVVCSQNTTSTPFVNIEGTGTLTSIMDAPVFTGGAGTRTVVSAPNMTDGGGTWSGVTVNGSAVTKAAGQIDL